MIAALAAITLALASPPARRSPTSDQSGSSSTSAAALQKASVALAIPETEIVAFISAGRAQGLGPKAVLEGLFAIGDRAHQAKYEGNNEAAAGMSQLGLELKYIDGVPQVGDYVLDLAVAIHRQRDPYTQAHICELLGCSILLPVLRSGTEGLKGSAASEARQ